MTTTQKRRRVVRDTDAIQQVLRDRAAVIPREAKGKSTIIPRRLSLYPKEKVGEK